MKTRKEMKTTATSVTKKQPNMNTKHPSEATIKKKRVKVYIPMFKSEEASAVKQENSFNENPILQLDEAIAIKREDSSIDEKLLFVETTSTEQNNPIDMNYTKPKDEPDNYCNICKRSFASNAYCRQHIRRHYINKAPLKRGRKPKEYKIQSNIIPVVDDPNYYCRSCNYQFASKDTYRVHLKTIHKMKLEPLQKSKPRLKPQSNITPVVEDPNNNCRSCNYQFVSGQAYRSHLMTVHKMKLAPLPKGRLRFKAQPDISPVVDDPNHNCRSCNYQFSNKQTYRKHLIIVHKIKPELSHKSKPKLKAQPDISPVVDDPNHNCRSCNYQFASKDTYRVHLKTIHKMELEPLQKSKPRLKPQPNISPVVDDPNYYCRSCNYHFVSRQAYRIHLKSVHKMKLKPSPKGKFKLKPQPNMSPVVDDPSHNCRSCNYRFATKQNYRRHLMIMHKMKLAPLQNGKPKRNQQPHILPVIDDPNYYCRSCNYRFASKDSYRMHLKTVHRMKLETLQSSKPWLKPQPDITPVVDDPNYNCRSCNHRFATKQSYRRHLMTAHKMKLEPLASVPKMKAPPNMSPVIDDPNYHCQTCTCQFRTNSHINSI